jgi:DHA1 family multidrug resistance protein-like MFS transporter
LVIIYFVLPESLPEEHRQRDQLRLSGPSLSILWKALWGPVGFLLVLAFLLSFGLANFESVFGLYAMERYGYGTQTVGWVLTLVGVTSALMQGVMTGPLTRRFGERLVIKVALVGSAIGFFLITRAQDLPQVLAAVTFFIISNAILNPANSSLISRSGQGGQGMMMGLNNSFQSLGRIAGPLWAGFVFDLSIHAPYLTGTVIMLVAFALSLVWLNTGIVNNAAEAAT